MKYFLFIIPLILGLEAFPQHAKSKKMYKQFEKGKLSKSKKIAQSILKKDKHDPDANFVLAILEINACKESNSRGSQKRAIKSALSKRNMIKDHSSQQYEQLSDSITYIVYSMINENNLTPNYKKFYVKTLAEEFKDTIPAYWEIVQFGSNTNNALSSSIDIYPQDSLRNVMLTLAKKLEGTPYKWAGDKPETGFDCSGFTSYIYKSIGIELPHSAQLQSELFKKRKNLNEAIPGDLIFFGSRNGKKFRTRHAGIIYSINGENIEVVHCVSNGVNIEGKESSWDRYWINEVLFIVDVLSNQAEPLRTN